MLCPSSARLPLLGVQLPPCVPEIPGDCVWQVDRYVWAAGKRAGRIEKTAVRLLRSSVAKESWMGIPEFPSSDRPRSFVASASIKPRRKFLPLPTCACACAGTCCPAALLSLLWRSHCCSTSEGRGRRSPRQRCAVAPAPATAATATSASCEQPLMRLRHERRRVRGRSASGSKQWPLGSAPTWRRALCCER